ncbi:putative fimbrial subunit SteE [Serratia proteamaculans]|uniref:fimbrial protein n=1 Tax=Serratia proteamaculans TaxID=28151 RepID=UPI00217BE899|nr:fimbrial protein [Serratia proteamaculans]CAI1919846.1 putative fimbrial subunit SteE [Serratia proteamaculans]CAI2430772.1 putative fimbrial subunit SteE [Serratia proteamaculans]
MIQQVISFILFFSLIFLLNIPTRANLVDACWTSPTMVILVDFGVANFTNNKAGATANLTYGSAPSSFGAYCNRNDSSTIRSMSHYIDYGPGIIQSTINASWYRLSNDVDIRIRPGKGWLFLPIVATDDLTGSVTPPNICNKCWVNGFMVAGSGFVEVKLRRDVIGGAIIVPANFELFSAYRVLTKTPRPPKPSAPIIKLVTKSSGIVIPVPTVCEINNGNTINVAFGNVETDIIGTNPSLASQAINVAISIACNTSLTQDSVIRLVAASATFSDGLMATSNTNLGIAMQHNGHLVKPFGTFPIRLTNGSGQEQITLYPVKNAIKEPKEGAFTASATLVVESL